MNSPDLVDVRASWMPYEWASAIKAEHGKSVESVLNIGRLFLAAKETLPHGAFQHLFVDLPIDRRMAEIYMAIARHEVIGNAKYVSHFPQAVSTLYELSRFPPAALERALTDGRVHPGLQREQVRFLFTYKYDPETPVEFPVYDEHIECDYRCPNCQYEWSGQPKPDDYAMQGCLEDSEEEAT